MRVTYVTRRAIATHSHTPPDCIIPSVSISLHVFDVYNFSPLYLLFYIYFIFI